MSIKGRPYTWFTASLDSGDLPGARAAAAELPRITLDDALRLLALIAEKQPNLYDKAAVRWLGRFCLEARGPTLEDVHQVAEALERLPDSPDRTAAKLGKLLSRR